MPDTDDDQRPLNLLARPSHRLDVRVVILEAGRAMAYDPADWTDTIVEVEAGTIDVETRHGTAIEFRAGAVLWLIGLPVRARHNRHTTPAVLVAASRRRLNRHDAPG